MPAQERRNLSETYLKSRLAVMLGGRCLSAARAQLDQLVELLLKEETVNSTQLLQILGPRRAV